VAPDHLDIEGWEVAQADRSGPVNATPFSRRWAARYTTGQLWARVADWMRGRPGTAASAVFAMAYALYNVRLPSPQYKADHTLTLASRAALGVDQILVVVLFFAFMATTAYAARRWDNDAEAERVARWLARPKWRCRWPWPLVATGAAGLAGLAWWGLDHVVEALWNHGPAGTYNDLPDHRGATVVAAAITFVVCAPILEELFFRGGIQAWLARRLPWPLAMLIATAFFMAVHSQGPHAYNSVQLVSVFSTGLLYASLFQVTGSVLPGIVAHMSWNAHGLVTSTAGLPSYLVAAPLVVVGIVGVLLLKHIPRRPDPVPAPIGR